MERALRFFMAKAEIGELEKRFAEEARQVFYEENTIVVWSEVVQGFLEGSYGDKASGIPVCNLVRQTTIKFTSYVELFEFIAETVRNFHFTHSVTLKVETDGRGHGTAPGKLRILCVILKMLLLVLYLIISRVVLDCVRPMEWMGSLLIGVTG